MSLPNHHPEGFDSQDSVDLPSTPTLRPSTSFDSEDQYTVSESAGLASVDATMDRNPVDRNSDDEGENEQRVRSQTPRARTLSTVLVTTEIPSTGSSIPDLTSEPTQSLGILHLDPNQEPNISLNHITSLPQTAILNYISAYRLARQRAFEEYVHPLLSPPQAVAPASAWRPGSGFTIPLIHINRMNRGNQNRPIPVTRDQHNTLRSGTEREISPQARMIVPSSIAELENESSTGIDLNSHLHAQMQVQSDLLLQASPDSSGRMRDTLTHLMIRRIENQAREQARDVDVGDSTVTANPSIARATVSEARDLNSENVTSRPQDLAPNQDNPFLSPADRALFTFPNGADSLDGERINAVTAGRRARTGPPSLPLEIQVLQAHPPPNIEPANTYYTANPPTTNRSDINRRITEIGTMIQTIRERYLSELGERGELMSGPPEVQDLLNDFESQIGRMRDQSLSTALTRPETSRDDGGDVVIEDVGADIDLGLGLTRPLSRQSDIGVDQDDQPVLSMAEQLAAYQISRNNQDPESSHTNRNISRDISPRQNSELPNPSRIQVGYENDIENITTRIQLARIRAELQLIEVRLPAGGPPQNRDVSPYQLQNTNTVTRAPRLRPSTSYEDLRLERQLAALPPGSARNAISARQRNFSPEAQRERDAVNAHRMEMLQKPATRVFDHFVKWQMCLENAATRVDSRVPEEWRSRTGKYTLIPAFSSANYIEDVSGIIRTDDAILAAYSANTSYGFREILRLARVDGLCAREAWHYVLLWKEYLSESPIDEYYESLGFCPMDIFMHVAVQGLDRGFGDWEMSARCKQECKRYLATRTTYYPFPSAETQDAATALGDVTSRTLRDYFGSDISLLDEEWDMLAALKSERYSTARILHLAKNIARGCAKLDTVELKPPYDESNNAQRKDIFHRLKLEETALAGKCGILSSREHQALSTDEMGAERALVEYMLEWELVPEERNGLLQAFDRGASLESLVRRRRG
ncbi:hypothetical protein BcDW1_9954 [Botrytis cinerea BcDW1]|uniref:Uncharacterized protein n=1 Tax=Botryotinia fuckeliana (strain BcDW1) TaxID=1290391 RepID=M7TJY3_BOTF1|nr:hypothetical protein BcDW1_9954 [Botrytis cinerea BcDW1]